MTTSFCSSNTSTRRTWVIDVAFITLILGCLFFILLGTRPLFVPDEGRYAEIGRELLKSGDYITPYLNGIKYFEKPILFYWLGAIALKIGGINIWAIRSVNACLGLLGCLFTYAATRKLYDRLTGLLASLILGTSTLYFVMTRMVSLDLPVTVFLSLTLFAFLLGMQHPPGCKRRGYLYGATIAAALAVLTKGLIGLIFPGLIIFCWLIGTKQWRQLAHIYLPTCFLLFLAITAPWHILVGMRNPEFFYFYFIEQHFLRYLSPDVGHYQPIWFFIPALIAGFFPWIVFLPQTLFSAIRNKLKSVPEQRNDLFFLLWVVIIFGFFSFSKSKLIPYILPLFPALAVLTARYLRYASQRSSLGLKISYLFLVGSAFAIAYAAYGFLHQTELPDIKQATFYLTIATSALCLGSLIGFFLCFRSYCKAIMATIITSGVFLISLSAAMPSVDTRTILPLATILNNTLKPTDEVITYNQYYQDLPFYLQRRVTILNWKNELTYGMAHQDTREWMIRSPVFKQRWQSKQRVFAIIGRSEYEDLVAHEKNHRAFPIYILGQTLTNLLISNQPAS